MTNLAQAITALLEAQQAHDKGHDGYEGGSWGYHGHYLIEAVRQAEDRVTELLTQAIDERIEVRVGHLLNHPNA